MAEEEAAKEAAKEAKKRRKKWAKQILFIAQWVPEMKKTFRAFSNIPSGGSLEQRQQQPKIK